MAIKEPCYNCTMWTNNLVCLNNKDVTFPTLEAIKLTPQCDKFDMKDDCTCEFAPQLVCCDGCGKVLDTIEPTKADVGCGYAQCHDCYVKQMNQVVG